MTFNIFFSHSLARNDYKLFRNVFSQVKDFGIEVTFIEGETAPGPISPAVQEAITKSSVVLAFLMRKGSTLTRVLDEIEFARRNQRKYVIIAERGLQSEEVQRNRLLIPFDARYPIDTVKRSVSVVRDLRLKREDGERIKGLLGTLVFMKVVAYFSTE
jgi:hypothetical protein